MRTVRYDPPRDGRRWNQVPCGFQTAADIAAREKDGKGGPDGPPFPSQASAYLAKRRDTSDHLMFPMKAAT
jgi:hypothetical protein